MTKETASFFTDRLAAADPDVLTAINHELNRQRKQIELIASENIVSRAVLEAQGSVFTNKYAEGYPGKRYYQGCAPSDEIETLAIERAKKLFGSEFVNVQPHSGAQANGAVLLAVAKPGDTIMGLSLDAGGHLTHGAKAAMSGKWFNAVQYAVHPETQLIDYDQVRDLALKTNRALSLRVAQPIPVISILPSSVRLPMKSELPLWLTWRISPVWLRVVFTLHLCRMRILRRRPRIRPCGARAVV